MYVPEGNRSSSVRFRSMNCGCTWLLFTCLVSVEEYKSRMSSEGFKGTTSTRTVCRFCDSRSSTVDLAVVDWARFTLLPLFLLDDVTWGDLCLLDSSSTLKPSVGLKSPLCDGGFGSLREMKLRGSCKWTQKVIKSPCSVHQESSLTWYRGGEMKFTLRNKDTKLPLGWYLQSLVLLPG